MLLSVNFAILRLPDAARIFDPASAFVPPANSFCFCCCLLWGVAVAQPISQSIKTQISHLPDLHHVYAMSGNTLRGTPGRAQGRGAIPNFPSSPAAAAGSSSSIPRPVLEQTMSSHNTQPPASEAGGSTMSASRQKQTKRDEVCLSFALSARPLLAWPSRCDALSPLFGLSPLPTKSSA